jgi:hypothetical protein
MKFTDNELQHIVNTLKSRSRITANKELIEIDKILLKKIEAGGQKRSPVIHFQTKVINSIAIAGSWIQGPLVYSPCGLYAPEVRDARYSYSIGEFTIVKNEVTCRRCRKILHMEPIKLIKKPKFERNITLNL